jgi:hypothetical protein
MIQSLINLKNEIFVANDDYYRFDNARTRAGPHPCVGCGAEATNYYILARQQTILVMFGGDHQ